MTSANITNSATVDQAKLPLIGSLLRSTLAATTVAAALAVTCVLPAEYASDPTGIGRIIGLTEMGEIKRDAELKRAEKAKNAEAPTAGDPRMRLASSTHIISDAVPIGGAWGQFAQAAPSEIGRAHV